MSSRELDAERRAAVTAIAQCVQRALTVLGAHTEPWVWELLGDLVHGRRRSEFDRLVQSTAQALATIDDGRGDPPVRATGPLPEGSVDALVAYLDFLENGGRARSYFRADRAARRRAGAAPAAGRRPRARDLRRAEDRAHALRAG